MSLFQVSCGFSNGCSDFRNEYGPRMIFRDFRGASSRDSFEWVIGDRLYNTSYQVTIQKQDRNDDYVLLSRHFYCWVSQAG